MRKFPIYLLVSLLAISNSQSAYSATAKAGAICSKSGALATVNKIKYQCTKTGKKLIWVKVPMAAASPTPTKTDSPSAEVLKVQQLITQLSTKISRTDSPIQVTLLIDPKLSKSKWSADSVASIKMALKVLTALDLKPANQLKLVISQGPEFRDMHTPESCHWDSGGGSCGQGIMFADLAWFAKSLGYSSGESSYLSEMDKFTITANVPHEIGHVAQDAVAATNNNFNYWKLNPAWLREGSAEIFKLITYSIDNQIAYIRLHDLYASHLWYGCKDFSLSKLNGQGSYEYGCEYAKGLFATELLISKVGSFDALMNFYKIEGDSTPEIFKKAYKLDLATFEAEADAYFLKVTKPFYG